MEISAVRAAYFSPTATTKKIVSAIAEAIAQTLGVPLSYHDFTLPEARKAPLSFAAGDLCIVGCPVYAGRVPNLMSPYIASMGGNGAAAVPVVLYGHRSFDDGLMDLRNLLEDGGFRTMAGGAFLGEHSFGAVLAASRPDDTDIAIAETFASDICQKLSGYDDKAAHTPIFVAGNDPVGPFFRPTGPNGEFIDIRKVRPDTLDSCTDCGFCAAHCPLGSIVKEEPRTVSGICIKCNACVKGCPTGSKVFTDPTYLFHRDDIFARYGGKRKEPTLFL